ncbi:hypothetical protein GCM10009665_64300 [Kitasatospora nipponensis]|uniref:Integral membrane protein n=1 Tax=Kitasatospora nipponensis TaxID=258049 RepID=A0ABN1WUM5_9ACTN
MTSATSPLWPEGAGIPTRVWLGFRAWRRTRPFWGGLLAIAAGFPILYFPYAHLTLGGLTLAMATTAGAGSLIIGVLMMVLGVAAWFQPATRVFCGIAVTILSLISIPVSNLGGFLMGLLLGLVAGGLLCAWAPLKPAQQAELAAQGEAQAQAVVAEFAGSDPQGADAQAVIAEAMAAQQAAAAQDAPQQAPQQVPAQESPAQQPAAPAGQVPAQDTPRASKADQAGETR